MDQEFTYRKLSCEIVRLPKFSMINEPVLSSHQCAVLMADGATGQVLSSNGEICRNGNAQVFVVFDDLEAARLFIKKKQDQNDTWEFIIYNSNYECVESWEARRWKH